MNLKKLPPPPLILGWLRPYFPRSLIQISLESHLIFFWNLSLKTSYFLQKKKTQKTVFFLLHNVSLSYLFYRKQSIFRGKKVKKKIQK